jgi:hypothetical protein
MSTRFWARLRCLLEELRSYESSSLRLPQREEHESPDVQMAALLQGKRSSYGPDDDAVRRACAYVVGLQELMDKRYQDGQTGFDRNFPLVEVSYYGLKPEGNDELHDWAFERLKDGAGRDGSAVVDLDSVESSQCEEKRPVDDVAFYRDGIFEAEISLIDVRLSGAIVAARKVMHFRKESVDLCVKIVASLDGKGKKLSPQRIDRLKVRLERADASAEKARTKADALAKRASELAAKASHRKNTGKQKEEHVARKDLKLIKNEERKIKLLQEKEQQLKQASFMKKFVRPTSVVGVPLTNPLFSQSTLGNRSRPAASLLTATGADVSNVDTSESLRELKSLEIIACPKICHEDDVLQHPSCPTTAPVSAGCAKLSTTALPYSRLANLPLCPAGLPNLRSPEICPVSRWLQCLVPVLSESLIDAACSTFHSHAVGTAFYLNELLCVARGRRRTAEEKLPALLRFQRRIRQENQHDMAPRFARRRADLRGHAGDRYGSAPIKLLQFDKESRPPYVGTMRRRSRSVRGRKPLGKDPSLDYEYDSADEWEEEENDQGESLSDDEKDKELEDTELRILGMLNDDSDTDDEDFLDDDDADDAVAVRDKPDDCPTDDFDEGADELQRAARLGMVSEVIDVDKASPIVIKRLRAERAEDENLGYQRKRKRTSKRGIRPPRVVLAGPTFEQTSPDPTLDQFRIQMHAKSFPITMLKCIENDAGKLSLPSSFPCEIPPGTRRRKEILSAECLDDLAKLMHGNSRGRDAIVEFAMNDRRRRNLQIPTKAEVQRAIDRLSFRVKNQPWQLRDPDTVVRLGLASLSPDMSSSAVNCALGTPATPQLGWQQFEIPVDGFSPDSCSGDVQACNAATIRHGEDIPLPIVALETATDTARRTSEEDALILQ